MLLKNLVRNKIGTNTVNNDQTGFVFDPMKSYNVNSFSQIKNLDNKIYITRICMIKVSLKHLKFF